MKTVNIVILCLGIGTLVLAQNLVPNPSFEEYIECPETGGIYVQYAMDFVAFWETPTISTDYHHVCGALPFAVPWNVGGYQMPRTGDAYAGMITWSGPNPLGGAAEYLSCPLITTLLQDSFYVVEFYMNRSGGASNNFSTDEISILFTDTVTTFPYTPPPTFTAPIFVTTPQLTNSSGNFIMDTIGWQRLKWIYQAKGNESFMTVGVFKTHEDINYIAIDPIYQALGLGYYYFDDFRIEKIDRHLAWSGLGQDTVICSPELSLVLSGNSTHFHYEWNTGDSTQNITVSEPGVYVLSSWFADSCVVVDSILIEHIVPATLDLGLDLSLCLADLPYIFEAQVADATYLWSTGDTLTQILATTAGDYWVEVTHPCGIFRDTVSIDILYPPPLDIGTDSLICGEVAIDILLQASSGYDNYLWSTDETTQSIQVNEEGVYWIAVFHPCGSFRDTVHIIREASLSLDLGQDTILCLQEGLRLTAINGFSNYIWNTGETTPSIIVDDYGSYILTATYPCGTLHDTIEVIAPPEWHIEIPEQVNINFGESILLSPEIIGNPSIVHYSWSPTSFLSCTDCLTTTASPESTRTYQLVVSDIYGCEELVSVAIIVNTPHPTYFPSAFSPNNDGINDIFAPLGGLEVDEVLSFMIFDRWGNQLYKEEYFSANGQTGWNGTSKGKKLSSAVFVYLAEIRFKDGETEVFSGEVVLVR